MVAINADYFPFTGDPLGAMVKDGELLSSPFPGRATLCWGEGFVKTAYLGFSASLRFNNGIQSINGVNEECLNDMVVFNTPTAQYATANEPATHVVLDFSEKVTPTGTWKVKVKRVESEKKWIKLEENEAALTFRGSPAVRLDYLNPKDEVTITIECTGADWTKTREVIAGGPILLTGGKKFIPYKEEGFTEAFATKRHPRTAVGKTAAGDVWIVAVDGRQTVSAGMTLDELADTMKGLGCVEAINMDGGGSTTLNIRSLTLNRPSGGAERLIANTLLVYNLFDAPVMGAVEVPPVIAGPSEMLIGETAQFRIVDSTGAIVSSNEILWSATGAGWIDQAGVLHGDSEGECRILVRVRGFSAELPVKVKKV